MLTVKLVEEEVNDKVMMGRLIFFFQAEDGIRDLVRSRGLGDVYKRQPQAEQRLEETSYLPPEAQRLFDGGL